MKGYNIVFGAIIFILKVSSRTILGEFNSFEVGFTPLIHELFRMAINKVIPI